MDTRNKKFVSWIPAINIVYHGYQTEILSIMDTIGIVCHGPRHKCCESWLLDQKIVYHGYQTQILCIINDTRYQY